MRTNLYFKDARLEAYEKWKQVICLPETQISNQFFVGENETSIECKWQKRAREKGYDHINLFCSLSAWADNITDLVTETRYDNLEFQYLFGSGRTLSRFYFRFLLIASEYFVDFCDIYKKILDEKVKDRIIRNEISPTGNAINLNDFFAFTNTLVKHKTSQFHKYNQHLLYLYADYNYLDSFNNIEEHSANTIKIGNIKISKDTKYFYFPKLVEIIELIEFCYLKIIDVLQDDAKFIKICEAFKSERNDLLNMQALPIE